MPGLAAKPFRHSAFLYDDRESFLAGAVPFIREGLASGERVMVAVDPGKIDLLSTRLGADSDEVIFADMRTLGANPAVIISAWETFLGSAAAGQRMRGIGEPIWPERTEDELVEAQLHEALLNRAFADAEGFELLCPYDTSSLAMPVLNEACCSHPVIMARDHDHVSPLYRGLDALPPATQAPLAPPPSHAQSLGFDRHNLAEVRALTAEVGLLAGLDAAETDKLVLGVHELAANSVRHGGGIGVLRAWVEDSAAVCEVRDTGHITDPLAGRHAPRSGQLGGWGLWLANSACSLMQVRTGQDGTVIRLRRERD